MLTSEAIVSQAFLLTRHWQDTSQGLVLDYWWASEQGPLWTRITGQEVVFFVARDDMPRVTAALQQQRDWRSRELALRNYLGEAVNGLYFLRLRDARAAERLLSAQGVRSWEADIRPPERYLMERFITAAAHIELSANSTNPVINPTLAATEYRPQLRQVSLDIETTMDAKTLFSIAVYSDVVSCVFMVGEGESTPALIYCKNQRQCLLEFFAWLEQYDPDVLIGWNLVQFDLWVLENLCKSQRIELALGRGRERVHWRQEFDDGGRRFITIPGRVALDGIELLKAANYRFDSYALQSVAESLLGESKLLHGPDRGEDIADLFHSDKPALAAYNLRDCELVWKIFTQQKLVQFAMERSQLTGLLLDRIGGSVAAFEYLYLPRLHRSGFVAPNLGELESDVVSPGGYVMDSRPGIYDNILVLDFKSLYPSIMRTFLIDPCAFWLAEHDSLPEEETLEGYNGAFFARKGHILPQ
ncbi:MAG TPA: 3'-5' exonuclease, partial [Cellvibrionaceae bacterium]